ncbi:RES family NAD+ phosphorylase [Iamia sp.]|uniref:RES family NAD+ phosphorylase n=1 Tax=Iamia sp. TaxID=2722710 RepID=UPI002D0F0977|nr:RES family NAD+ phosphorylase [Iamia sp.]HXH55932.1 RES family NAD+ phosphorylase [Iamia sp.]
MAIVDVPDGHPWNRLADPTWTDPIDATFAAIHGARWTPPGGPSTLYLNTDETTARANLQRFLADAPFAPEDLNDANGYQLVPVALPDGQHALDALTDGGLSDVGLPDTYPLDHDGAEIAHAACQPIGADAYDAGLDGVRCRSAAGISSELAWFPRHQAATPGPAQPFSDWYFEGS